MQVLNDHRHCAIDIRATGPGGEICELAVIPMQGMARQDDAILKMWIRPEDWGRAKAGVKYRNRVESYGVGPRAAESAFLSWYDGLGLRFNKRLIPIAYNWPEQREYLRQWLGPTTFGQVFHATEYRDLIPILRYWTEYQYRSGEHIPFPKCSLRHFAARFGIDLPLCNLDCLAQADIVRQCYEKILNLYLPLGYNIPLFEIMPIDYEATEIDDDTALSLFNITDASEPPVKG